LVSFTSIRYSNTSETCRTSTTN